MSTFTVTQIDDFQWVVTINGVKYTVTSMREAIKLVNSHFWTHNWGKDNG